MNKNVLVIGAGGVAHVVAHKCAQNNHILGDICIASRTKTKCDAIVESIKRKNNLKSKTKKLHTRSLNAFDVAATARLIRKTSSSIVINVASPYVNMSVLGACIKTGSAYMDTAIHEEPDKPCEDPPWYANYEWPRKEECRRAGVTAILGTGFDPGVVNAYAATAVKHHFDVIDTIDIMDVNAGKHGYFFATNFDPEINFREFVKVWTWINRKWVCLPMHSVKRTYNFPVVGKQPIYLSGHDEIHSLSQNIKANSIRFWMGFGDHYINCFNVLKNTGLLSHKPVKTAEGREVVPLKVVKACLPDPASLAPRYKGKTCIGDLIKGNKNGKRKEILLYNISDHKKCYNEVESQAISYTAGVPPAAAAICIATGEWDIKTMANVEELDPDPFIKTMNNIGLHTKIKHIKPGSSGSIPSNAGMPKVKRSTKTSKTTKQKKPQG